MGKAMRETPEEDFGDNRRILMKEINYMLERLNVLFRIIHSTGWFIERVEIRHAINRTLDSSNYVLLLKLSVTLRFRKGDPRKPLERVYDLKNKLLNAGFRVSIGGEYMERLEDMLDTVEGTVNEV